MRDHEEQAVPSPPASPPPSSGIGAVVTLFFPGVDALRTVEAARRDCDVVVVVDNTEGDLALPFNLPSDVLHVRSGSNVGLARALNVGVAHLPVHLDRVLLLDQDSVLPAGAVAALSQHLTSAQVAVAAPTPWDVRAGRPVDPLRRLSSSVDQRDVVITSGMLVRRRALETVGGFREDFFVDAVDQDLCLRLRRTGWRILQDDAVLLQHELGDLRWRRVLGLTLRSTGHPTWRLYAAARNGAVLLREHVWHRPRWVARQTAQLAYWLLTILLLEPPRLRRGAAFTAGVLDGLRGRGTGRPDLARWTRL